MNSTPTTVQTRRTVLNAWRTPIYQADLDGADAVNLSLREMILAAEKTDTQAALFGGIDAIKSSQDILRWNCPEISWLRDKIMQAVTALTSEVLGDAASEVSHGVLAEAWAVVYRGGGSLRPHTHHDSAWSGVYYVDSGAPDQDGNAGYLQLLDPRPAAIARQASGGVRRIRPVPGRMVAFPGWLPHSVQATLTDGGLRICIAFNVAYDKTWKAMS